MNSDKRITFHGLTPEDFGAEPSGTSTAAAAAAEAAAIAYTDSQIASLTPGLIGADPAGSAAAAEAAAEAYTNSRITALSPGLIGADPAGSAAAAEASAIAAARIMFENLMPTQHFHLWGQGRRIVGADFFRGRTTFTRFAYFAYQNPASSTDEVAFDFLLKSGSYRFEITAQRQANAATVQFSLNDVPLGAALDLYATSNGELNFTNTINLAASGSYTFRSKVTGKNAASTGFFVPLTSVMFWRV